MGSAVPPHDPQAEESLLGAMLLNRKSIEMTMERLDPSDFHNPCHGQIYAAILKIYGEGNPVDPVTVADVLRREDTLSKVGGPPRLIELQLKTPSTTNARSYAKIVKDHALLRRSISLAGTISENAYDMMELDVLLANAKGEIDAIFKESDHGRLLITPEQAGHDFLDLLEERAEGQNVGISTGFPDIDRMTGGLRWGEVWVLGAQSSAGKSSVAGEIALSIAKQGYPVLFVSLEMSQNELMERFICRISGVPLGKLRHSDPNIRMTTEENARVIAAVDTYAGLPIFIHDNPYANADEVIEKALGAKIGDQHGVIIIDYLQLVKSRERRRETRQVEVADMSIAMKAAARHLECSVLELSQLRRADSYSNPNPVPDLDDLRESGQIGQDASVVLMLHRPSMDNPQTDGDMDFYIVKNRNGPKVMIPYIFTPRTMKFTPRTRNTQGARDSSGPSPRSSEGNTAADILKAKYA